MPSRKPKVKQKKMTRVKKRRGMSLSPSNFSLPLENSQNPPTRTAFNANTVIGSSMEGKAFGHTFFLAPIPWGSPPSGRTGLHSMLDSIKPKTDFHRSDPTFTKSTY